MKIALSCPASLPASQFGGIMFLCLDIAKESSSQGHDVTIFTTDMDFANNPHTFNKKLPRKERFKKFLINRSHVWFSIQLFFVNPGMYNQMSKEDFDIIHSIGIRSFQSLISAVIARRKKIPLVLSDQGGLTTHPNLNSSFVKKFLIFLQKPFIKFIIDSASKISVPNDYEKHIFLEFCDENKIVVIPNGVNLETLQIKEINFKKKFDIKTDFFLFIGRFSKIKGIDVLIESIKLLKKKLRDMNIKLIIMGVDFGYENVMIEMIEMYDLGDVIKIIRNPSREDVIQSYSESLFLVYPSRWELSPLTPLEAFAFKKTVISTNAHGIPFTITNGDNCILIENEDVKGLADAILELVGNKQKRTKYGESGYKLVRSKNNSRTMVNKTLEMYYQIINN